MNEHEPGGDGADFELEEEEYREDEEPNSIEPNKWCSVVNEIRNEGPVGEDKSEGVRFERDLDIFCSDEEE